MFGRELEGSNLCDTFPRRKTSMDVTSNRGIRIPEAKHRGIRTGMATNNIAEKLRGNVEVFYCHPLSHLERRAIKSNPMHLWPGHTLRIETGSKLLEWPERHP